jgi:hypothetical protein
MSQEKTFNSLQFSFIASADEFTTINVAAKVEKDPFLWCTVFGYTGKKVFFPPVFQDQKNKSGW